MIRALVLTSLALFPLYASVSVAALPPKRIQPELLAPKVDLNIAEILSLPAPNRFAVAQNRRADLLPELDRHAFDSSKGYADRWKAVVLYAQLSGDQSVPFLNRALKSDQWFMRNAALISFQEVMPTRAAAAAKTLLSDKALVVRSAAVQVLESHMDSEVRELLWSEIDQPRNFRKKQSLWTRPQILELLAKEPSQRELPLFITYLRESDPRMHQPAVLGLERITRQNLGKPETKLADKRGLWLNWSKKTETL